MMVAAAHILDRSPSTSTEEISEPMSSSVSSRGADSSSVERDEQDKKRVESQGKGRGH